MSDIDHALREVEEKIRKDNDLLHKAQAEAEKTTKDITAKELQLSKDLSELERAHKKAVDVINAKFETELRALRAEKKKDEEAISTAKGDFIRHGKKLEELKRAIEKAQHDSQGKSASSSRSW